MTEYIITDLSNEQIKLLEENDIDWFLDSLESNDVLFEDFNEYQKAVNLLRKDD